VQLAVHQGSDRFWIPLLGELEEIWLRSRTVHDYYFVVASVECRTVVYVITFVELNERTFIQDGFAQGKTGKSTVKKLPKE
jgi:hypothetical protein